MMDVLYQSAATFMCIVALLGAALGVKTANIFALVAIVYAILGSS